MNYIFELNKLEIPIFQLDGAETRDPIACLSYGTCKPLKKAILSKAKVLVLFPEHISYKEKSALRKLLSDLEEGIKGVKVKRWKGFSEVFNIDLELEFKPYIVNKRSSYVSSIIQILREHRKIYDLFIIFMPEYAKSRIGGPYFKVKAYSMLGKIKEQILIKSTLEKVLKYRNENILRYNDLIWNFALSIFTKLGGTPWKLKRYMDNVFLAVSTIVKPDNIGSKQRAGIAVLQMYNNWGEYESSVYGKLMFVYEEAKGMLAIGDSDSEDRFLEIVSTIANDVKGKNITVHLTDLYSKEFHELLYQALVDNGAVSVKIIRVQSSSPLRLYMNIEEAKYAWPEVGAYWFLEPGKVAQLYTTGKWRYSPRRPPYVIHGHAIRPVQVSLEYPENSELTPSDLRDILWLTKLYPYMLDAPRTRMPIDMRLCRRYAQIVASDENVGIPEDVTYLY